MPVKKLSSNMEDYLEAVAALKKEKKIARVKDIARLLDVKTSSVTAALNALTEEGLIIHEKYGYVDLTKEGERLAEDVQRRHDTMTKFLTGILDIDSKTAQEDACKIEHSLSPKTLKRLTEFIKFVENCPHSEKSCTN